MHLGDRGTFVFSLAQEVVGLIVVRLHDPYPNFLAFLLNKKVFRSILEPRDFLLPQK